MNLRKFISGVSALAIAASAFAGMAVTANAEDTEATLTHTASVGYGSNTGYTVDAENEYYNNDATTSWGAFAFAEFDLSSLPAGEITNAVLTFEMTQGGRVNTSRDTKVYYLTGDVKPNYTEKTDGMQFSSSRTLVKTITASATSTTQVLTHQVDVTDAIKARKDEEKSFVVFQFTGNAGGANLLGKGSENAPTLVITTSQETFYTATFTETNNVNATVKIYSDSEMTTEVRADQLSANTTYYYKATAEGYEDYTNSFNVAQANIPVSYTMTQKTVAGAVTINYMADSNVIYTDTLNLNGYYAGDTYSYYYPAYKEVDGKFYHTTEASFGKDIALTSATQSIEVDYEEAASNIVFFQEAENAANSRPATWASATGSSVSSGATTTVGATNATVTFTVPIEEAAEYTFTLKACGSLSRKANILLDGIQVGSSVNNSTIVYKTQLTAGTHSIAYSADYSTLPDLDYLVVTKTGVAAADKAFTFETTLNGIAGMSIYVTRSSDGKTAPAVAINDLVEGETKFTGEGAAQLAIIFEDVPTSWGTLSCVVK